MRLQTLPMSLAFTAVVALGACGDGGATTPAPASDAIPADASAADATSAADGADGISGADVPSEDGPDAEVAEVVADGAPADALADADIPPTCPAGEPCDDDDACTTGDVCDGAGGCAGIYDATLPACPCLEVGHCDDGLICTSDTCLGGQCQHTPTSTHCLTPGPQPVCVANLLSPKGNTCLWCDIHGPDGPTWQTLAEGSPCSDGDACTEGDACQLGACVATESLICPSSACAEASCDSAVGCVFKPLEGPCDDGDVCTLGDVCVDGACVPGGELMDCDDGNPCSVNLCDPETGCVAEPIEKCNDLNPCTLDSCGADGECAHEIITGPIDDGDACTVGERCADGALVPGTPLECLDDNPCTADGCDPVVGCQHFHVPGDCDDGVDCTYDDKCVAGTCVGAKTSSCGACPVPVTDHAAKVVEMEISADGNPGSGLDVDEDPTTCAPAGDCAGGVDNALSVIASLLNDPLAEALEMGSVMYVADLSQASLDGEPFTMGVLDCELTSASMTAGCDITVDACAYSANQSSFGPDCQAYFGLEDVTIVDGKVEGGGLGVTMTMVLPLTSSVALPFTIVHARVSGSVTLDEEGLKVVGIQGFIGGATPKQQLMDTIEAVDPDYFPVDKSLVIELLDELIDNDIDLDGDGFKDAASVGLRFKTIPATLE